MDMSKQPVTPLTTRIGRRLALGAIIGPILLTVAWLVLGLIVPATRTEYGVEGGIIGTITSPISGIGVGPNDSLFNAAFIVSGLFTIIGVLGAFQILDGKSKRVARWINAALLALSPLGFIVAGIFTLAKSVPLHMIGFLLVTGTPVITFVTAGLFFRGIAGWHRFGNWLLIGSPLTLLLTISFFLTFNQAAIVAGQGIAGIPSRLLGIELGTYYVMLGWLALQRSR